MIIHNIPLEGRTLDGERLDQSWRGKFTARVVLTKGPLAQILRVSIPTTDILISAATDFPKGNSNKGKTKRCRCLFPLISVSAIKSRGSAIIGRSDRNIEFIVDMVSIS